MVQRHLAKKAGKERRKVAAELHKLQTSGPVNLLALAAQVEQLTGGHNELVKFFNAQAKANQEVFGNLDARLGACQRVLEQALIQGQELQHRTRDDGEAGLDWAHYIKQHLDAVQAEVQAAQARSSDPLYTPPEPPPAEEDLPDVVFGGTGS